MIAAEEHGLLAMTHSFGTLADGGEFELVFVLLVSLKNGGVVGMEGSSPRTSRSRGRASRSPTPRT